MNMLTEWLEREKKETKKHKKNKNTFIMGLFDLFKNMRSNNRKLASYYTDVHPAGLAFHIDGILGNLWEATNHKGKKEYFLMPHDECWNTMCSISNNHRKFCPDPNDFVLDFADLYVDLSEIYGPAKDEKMVWVYKM